MAAGLTAQDSKNVFFKGLSLYLESDEKRGNIKGEFYVEDMLELYKVQYRELTTNYRSIIGSYGARGLPNKNEAQN